MYTDERNVQIVLQLLKQYGVRRIIASPGTTNFTFVASVQRDGFFTVYSVVDERSAAYMACGMAAESGEPVALSCTGATASRNYLPGLTEAFYRHLPVVAITSTQPLSRLGNLIPQVIDRSQAPRDTLLMSVCVRTVHSAADEWQAQLDVNRALTALTARGGGPVHINLETQYSRDLSVESLPPCRRVRYFCACGADQWPEPQGRVAVFVGAHAPFDERLTRAVDAFCGRYDAAVFCDHTSGYHGPYRVMASLIGQQEPMPELDITHIDLLIHIGDMSADYATFMPFLGRAKQTWRVSPDGKMADMMHSLEAVFDVEEVCFFEHYAGNAAGVEPRADYAAACRSAYQAIYERIPDDLPFSNIWIAKVLAPMLPAHSVLHLGILNTIRSWNMFQVDDTVNGYCNTGGFGIDGCLSALMGAALANPSATFFGIFGDLAFFYDLNILGNRHRSRNVRLMLINNGCGTEFRNYNHTCATVGEEANPYMAAMGHNGARSRDLVRHLADDLGYRYLSAASKAEFMSAVDDFVSADTEGPVLFEVFTDPESESRALWLVNHLMTGGSDVSAQQVVKNAIKRAIGAKGVKIGRILLGRDED